MYATLGNIVFEGLKGFNNMVDEQAAIYAEHALVDSIPRLQRTGSALQTFDLSIKFHAAFCNPEVEFDALKKAMDDGEVLALIYGNGFYENDFVVTKIQRTVVQTQDNGDYIEINCDLNLKQYYDPNKLITRQQRDKLSAFAVDVERPLPAGTPQVDNTLSAQLLKYQMQLHNAMNNIQQKVNKYKAQINEYANLPNAAIGMGQQVVNLGNNIASEIAPLTHVITANVALMQGLLSGSPALLAISPTFSTLLGGTGTAANGLYTAAQALAGLSPVTNNTQGNAAVALFNNVTVNNGSLSNSFQLLNTGYSPFASFVAGRVIRL